MKRKNNDYVTKKDFWDGITFIASNLFLLKAFSFFAIIDKSYYSYAWLMLLSSFSYLFILNFKVKKRGKNEN